MPFKRCPPSHARSQRSHAHPQPPASITTQPRAPIQARLGMPHQRLGVALPPCNLKTTQHPRTFPYGPHPTSMSHLLPVTTLVTKPSTITTTQTTWKLSANNHKPTQLKRHDLLPLARGRHEFIVHSIIPTGNKSEITVARAILIHSIITGDDVRAGELIADNLLAIIAESVEGRNNLIFPSTIYRLCKAAGVPRRDFKGDKPIPIDKPIPTKMMIRVKGRYSQHNQMLQAKDGQNEQHDQEDEHEEDEHDAPQFQHANPNLQGFQEEHGYNLGQLQQDLSAIQKQQQEINELRKQFAESTRNSVAREAYCCWALQQTNPNLAPIPVTDIPTFMNKNATQKRGLFEGALWPQQVGESSDKGKGKAPLEKDNARETNANSDDE
ncbi:hypothetical protein PIB30_092374 [Stylosanthes scabra]|uniref:Putative plant transposon protein domain-containing protein n=1 Tax=Stylosanthes scabra TaxID=79078 RepID=A0ABU6WT59_9FABA|nr:hypothetical protein [Stylosanthes scabra]